jgi:hypothetical protein
MTTKEYDNKLQGKVILDLSMSLDGFIAGPNVSARHPLGEDGDFFIRKTWVDCSCD